MDKGKNYQIYIFEGLSREVVMNILNYKSKYDIFN